MGERSGKAGVALAGVAVVVGGWLGSAQRSQPPLHSAPPPSGTVFVETIEVHVSGWVVAPGVVSLPANALAAEAIAAAGGLRPGARVDTVNLAAPVADGTQLIVPGPSDAQVAPGAGTGGATGGPIAINRATAAELEALPGVGPVLAARIVAYRDENGPFSVVEDLLSVPGIGEAKLAALRDLITIP